MNRWLKALFSPLTSRSSVSNKYTMAITGLLLCGFLVVHLAGNLFMYVGEDAYNAYAHTLHSQEWFVKSAELGLLVLFLIHFSIAMKLTFSKNNPARKKSYREVQGKRDHIMGRVFSPENIMLPTGMIVLVFIVVHVGDFTFEARPDLEYEGKEPFEKALMILQNPISFAIYLAGCTFLGLHLGHGFSSAFQSLGLSNPKIHSCLKWVGIGFALLIALGFMSFVFWANLAH